MIDKFAENKGINIHYIILNPEAINIPIILIPGAISSAEDICDELKNNSNLCFIAISLRGRGKSSAPSVGYSLEDQISDVEAVVQAEGINKVFILGHSNGVGIATYYSIKHYEKVLGLILVDYPPGYPKFTEEWKQRIINETNGLSTNLLNGLVNESQKKYFLKELGLFDFKKLIIKGANEDSMLPMEIVQKIKKVLSNCTFATIDNCGHEVFIEKPHEITKLIEDFICRK